MVSYRKTKTKIISVELSIQSSTIGAFANEIYIDSSFKSYAVTNVAVIPDFFLSKRRIGCS